MKPASNHMGDDQLRVLLFEEEDSLASIEIAQHVETCATCQIRLKELVHVDSMELDEDQLFSSYTEVSQSRAFLAEGSFNTPEDHPADVDALLLEPPSHPELLGRIGRYEIERRIGSGGMGVVFKAIDTELNRPVAVKVLAPHLSRNGAARQRFSRESRAAAAVVHEHVVAIHNVDSTAVHPYLVMQYVSGESLQSRIDREGPLSVERILRIGIQTALGLSAAHQQGIIHRDIKPSNILLEDGVDRLLITDFGLARTVDDASLTHTGVVAGTPNYMSPEQASGDLVDHRTDLFSLGSVLYFVATGHPPFRAERAMGVLHRICRERHRPVWQWNASVPDELSAVIDRLLEKRPAHRFANAASVAEALTRILQQRQNRSPNRTTRWRSWGRRHPIASWSIASILIVVAGMLIGFRVSLLPPTAFPYEPNNNKPALTNDSYDPFLASENNGSSVDLVSQADNNESSVGARSPNLDRSPSAEKSPFEGMETWQADRHQFDQTIKTIQASLGGLERSDRMSGPDSSLEFQQEVRSLEQSLNAIDPTKM